jgi:protein gp37
MGGVDLAAVPPSEGAILLKTWGGVRKSRTGRELNGRTFDELPVLQ